MRTSVIANPSKENKDQLESTPSNNHALRQRKDTQLPPIPDMAFCIWRTVSLSHYNPSPYPSQITSCLSANLNQVYARPSRADELEKMYAETTRLAQYEKG
ncbi:hypothetical protein DPSP01_002780 [Paraphaeosphaeria sporulosa]